MGRPKLPEGRSLSHICHMRLEPDVLEEIRQAADQLGCNTSEAFRTCIKAVIYDDRQAKKLGRMLRDAVVEYKVEAKDQ